MTTRMKLQEPTAAHEIAAGYDKIVRAELTETEEAVYNAFYTVLFLDVNHVPRRQRCHCSAATGRGLRQCR
jgi:hypothetical protein